MLLLIGLQSAHLWFIRNNPTFNVPIIDSREYHELAQQIIAPDFAFSQPYFHSPFYAWFLAGIYMLAGPQTTVVRIVQMLLSVMSLLVLYGLSLRFFSQPAARVTAAALGFLRAGHFLLRRTGECALDSPPNLLSLYLVTRAIAAPGALHWLAAGLALGFAAITRPDVLAFAVMICAWLLWNALRTGAWKKQLGMMTLFLLGALAPATGVGMRNYAVARTFAPLPANSGLNFYIGNNPNYRQTIGIRPGAAWEDLINMPIRDGVGIDPHDIACSRYFYEKALSFIRSDFSKYLQGILYKFRTLFSGYELPETFDIYTFRKYSPIMQILVWRIGSFGFPFSLLLLLGVAGICLNIAEGRYRPLFPLYAMTSAFVVSLIFYWNSSRYRMSLVALLMLFAGYGAVGLWNLWRQRDIFAQQALYTVFRRCAVCRARRIFPWTISVKN